MNHPPTTAALPLTAGHWALDAAHSSVGFSIRHLGVSKVRGRFTRFDVDVVVGSTLATTSVDATIEVASLDTGNPDRDAHVLTPEFLDVAARPTMTFRSVSITEVGEHLYEVAGELTLGEVTEPATLHVELGGIETFPGGARHAGFEASAEVRRKSFGIAPGVPGAFLGEVVKVELDLQLVEPTPVPA